MGRDAREMNRADRIKELLLIQEAYPNFQDFLYDVMVNLMGFN